MLIHDRSKGRWETRVMAHGTPPALTKYHIGLVSAAAVAVAGMSCGDVPVDPPQPTVASVTVVSSADSLFSVGQTAQLTATAHNANGSVMSGKTFVWSSSDEQCVAIDDAGLATALADGRVTLSAEVDDVSGSAMLTVAQRAARIDITPAADTLTFFGETVQLDAGVEDANGNAMTGIALEWFSDDAAVATVSSSGLVSAAGNGTTAVSAVTGGVSGSAAVHVSQRVSAVTVSPLNVILDGPGDTAQLTATVADANGHSVAGVTLSWESSDEAVASVDGEGLVTGVAEGSATIAAASNSVSASASIAVNAPLPVAPVAVIDNPGQDTTVTLGDAVEFRGSASDADGDVVAHSWEFGDGNEAAVEDPGEHRYAVAGTFTATYRVTDNDGAMSLPASVVVTVNTPPEAPIDPVAVIDNPGQDTTVTFGDAVEFRGSASDADGTVVSHRWDFGDGSEAAEEDPGEHSFGEPGAYTVTYQVVDDEGRASAPASVVVTVNAPPVAVIESPSQDTTVTLGHPLDFQGSATDSDGDVVAHSWEFGDGNEAAVEDPGEHRYAVAGTFTATYRVTDNDGAMSLPASVVVTVNTPPEAAIENPSQDTTVTLGNRVDFQGSATDSDGDALAHSWDFGDGSESAVEDPGEHSYESEGTYTVAYRITDEHGATATSSVTVTVTPPTPMATGQWQSRQDPAEELGISFVVNPEGTGITEITYYFDGFRCGWDGSWSGVVSKYSAYPGWPITDGKFDFWNYLGDGASMRVDGTFWSDSLVSGSWSANIQPDGATFPTICNDMDPWALKGEPATKLYLRYDGVAPFLSHEPSPEGDDWVHQFADGETAEFAATLDAPIVSQDSAFSFAAQLRYGTFFVTLDVQSADAEERLNWWRFYGASAFRYHGATLQGKDGGQAGDRLVLGITYSGSGEGNHLAFGYGYDAHIVVPGRITTTETRGASPNATAPLFRSLRLATPPTELTVVKPERR